jgi:hypothetical protein
MIGTFLLWQREAWRAFWRQRATFTPAIITGVLLAANWALVFQVPSSELVIMRYSIYVGPTWIAPTRSLIIVPLVGSIFALVNLALAYVAGRSSVLLKYLWLWAAVVMAGGWLWLGWLLVRINS